MTGNDVMATGSHVIWGGKPLTSGKKGSQAHGGAKPLTSGKKGSRAQVPLTIEGSESKVQLEDDG